MARCPPGRGRNRDSGPKGRELQKERDVGMIAKIKENAKRALAGNWGKAIAILLILFAVSML